MKSLDSTEVIDAKDRVSARSSEGMKTEDGTASIDTGSHHKRLKRKKRKHSRTDGRLRSKKGAKSRRYYSSDDGSCDSGNDSIAHRRRREKKRNKAERGDLRQSKRKDGDRRKRRKRKQSYSSISDDNSSSSSSSSSDRKKKKKRRRKQCQKRRDNDRSSDNKEPQTMMNGEDQTNEAAATASALSNENTTEVTVPVAPRNNPKRKSMIPMSKEEYDKEQSKIREVYDPLSGRVRLVRGSGEIIERIVSSAAHRQINSLATSGDGYAFSKGIYDKLNR